MKKKKLSPDSFAEFTSISKLELNESGDKCLFLAVKPDLKTNSYKVEPSIINFFTEEKVKISSDSIIDELHWVDNNTLIYKIFDKEKRKTIFKVWRYPGTVINEVEFETVVSQFLPIDKSRIVALIRKHLDRIEEDYILTDEIPIWFNGVGFLENSRNVLFELDLENGDMVQISSDNANVNTFSVDTSNRKVIASLSEDRSKPYLSKFTIYDADRSYREHQILRNDKFSVLAIDLRNRIVASILHKLERGFSSHARLMLFDWKKEEVFYYGAPMGYGLSRRVYHDLRGPYAQLPKPRITKKYVYFLLSIGGRYTLYRYKFDSNNFESVIDGDFVIDEFDVSYNDNLIIYTKTETTVPSELYMYRDGKQTKLTNFNERLTKKYKFHKPERIKFKASDGKEVEGWIIIPKKNTKTGLPMIVNIHGGPKSKFGYSFMFEHQLFANNGFAVLYLNPRGSDGYTEDFADIRLKYGTRDYLDIIEGVRYAIEKFREIDPDRIGVTGISYGGFMTNWIVTQSKMFKAAISQNGISDWEAMYGTTDIGFYFVPDQIGGSILQNNEKLREKSPIYYAKNVETPIMFIHSMNDYRCYIDQAIMFHTVLKSLGKQSTIALFKEGGHTFGWNGKPRARLKRYKLMLDWFHRHLGSKDKDIATYK